MSTAKAEPAVLYIPDEDIELNPLGLLPCSSQVNSALGCLGDSMEVAPAYPNAAGLRASLSGALDPYDVHVTGQRPPEYLAYTMLLASDDPVPESASFTCSQGAIHCEARKRNGIVQVLGPTQNCPFSDPRLTSLFAFGRASGLEGVDAPLDAMYYPPDFSVGGGVFIDACQPIVNRLGFNDAGEVIELPLECTSLDHVGCPAQEQNGHADLLAYYGPRVVDVDPPVVVSMTPEDGSFIPPGEELVLDVVLSDADPVLGGRWTIYSSVLEEAVPGGQLTICTNDTCAVSWPDATPLKPTDSDWRMPVAGLPEGEYEVTFEASDFHGNVMEPVYMVIYVGIGPDDETTTTGGMEPETSTGPSMTGPSMTTSSTTTVALDESSGVGVGSAEGPEPGESSGGPAQDDGLIDPGCLCRSSPNSGWSNAVLLLLMGMVRRRRTLA
ncbi:MAG: hypothetical protein AAGF11_45790 [Myxococcota bacterium]